MTEINTQPSLTNFNINISWPRRLLESDYGYNKSIMTGLLGGIDYYFLPKICIGFELSLTLNYKWRSQANMKYEAYNGISIEKVDVATRPKGKNYSSFISEYGNLFGGSLYIMFNF